MSETSDGKTSAVSGYVLPVAWLARAKDVG